VNAATLEGPALQAVLHLADVGATTPALLAEALELEPARGAELVQLLTAQRVLQPFGAQFVVLTLEAQAAAAELEQRALAGRCPWWCMCPRCAADDD
jgi:hypothetical protein